jgi:integrase
MRFEGILMGFDGRSDEAHIKAIQTAHARAVRKKQLRWIVPRYVFGKQFAERTRAATALFIAETKTGKPRTVTMQERTRKALHALWVGAGSPSEGRVFLNRLGAPYADPRQYALPGGSPIRKAHATACGRAGIKDFTVHDWRHHWASWCVMSGIDLETLRQEGGWASLRMVERYAAVSAEHRANTMRKLGNNWAVSTAGEKKL